MLVGVVAMMKVLEKGSDFASEVEIGSGVLWLPYKNILQIVNRAVQDNSTEAFTELDTYAQKCKSDFVNFLNYRVSGAIYKRKQYVWIWS